MHEFGEINEKFSPNLSEFSSPESLCYEYLQGIIKKHLFAI